jgi:L-rhamnose 1-dehydrogenase
MAITGGATGIGRAIALGYLTHGANVAVNHLGDPKSLSQFQGMIDEAAKSQGISKEEVGKRLVEVPGDVADAETGKKLVQEVVNRWGRLDVFISNAGICEFKEFLEYVSLISPSLLMPKIFANRNGTTALHQPSGPKP